MWGGVQGWDELEPVLFPSRSQGERVINVTPSIYLITRAASSWVAKEPLVINLSYAF
jgi:hypothetical protein